jgi:hypothetical protein
VGKGGIGLPKKWGEKMAITLKPNVKKKLKEKNVSIFDPYNFGLMCDKCGKIWVPEIKSNKMPKGYWKCPNSCNS